MRRPVKRSTSKLSTESRRLIMLAQAMMQASSRLEERAWEQALDVQLSRLLKSQQQDVIDAAFDQSFRTQSATYDVLMEAAEANSESQRIEHDGQIHDALLVAVPVLAWTRYSIVSGAVPQAGVQALEKMLRESVLAPNCHTAVSPLLYSIDQLPRSHAETHALTGRLAQSALGGTRFQTSAKLPETAPFLADVRFLLAAVVVPTGAPIFRWQIELDALGREQTLSEWKNTARATFESLLPGCGIDLLLPDAYFAACREADKQIRPHTIRAAVNYLTHALSLEPAGLQAIIGGFSEEGYEGPIDEYRVSFSPRQEREVFYGVIWPLYDQEDAEGEDVASGAALDFPGLQNTASVTPIDEIVELLKQCGVAHIKRHAGCFPMDSCEDCGAPLYLDLDGELVHAEMPEDAPSGTAHFH